MQLNKDNFLRWDGNFTITEIIAINFAPANNVQINTLTTSSQLTIYGLTAIRPISVANGEMQINGGAWRTAPSTIQNGDIVKVRAVSSLNYGSSNSVTLTIGANSGVFVINTKVAPAVPVSISFGESSIPFVDSDIEIYLNGVLQPLLSTTGTRNYIWNAGDTVKIKAINPSGVWPVDSYRDFKVANNGNYIFNNREEDATTDQEFTFILAENDNYIVTVVTNVTSTGPVAGPYFLQLFTRFAVGGTQTVFYATLTDSSGNPATLGTTLNFNYEIQIYYPGSGTYGGSAGVASLPIGESQVDIWSYENFDSIVQYSVIGNPYPTTVDGHDIIV